MLGLSLFWNNIIVTILNYLTEFSRVIPSYTELQRARVPILTGKLINCLADCRAGLQTPSGRDCHISASVGRRHRHHHHHHPVAVRHHNPSASSAMWIVEEQNKWNKIPSLSPLSTLPRKLSLFDLECIFNNFHNIFHNILQILWGA